MIKPNTVIHGDCLEVMHDIDDKSVDLIITDPPYGIGFQSNHRKERHRKIVGDESLSWLPCFVNESKRIIKNDAHFYCFCSWHNVDRFKSEIQKRFIIKNILIWCKNNTGMGDLNGDYAPQYEMIMFCSNGKKHLNGRRKSNLIYAKRTKNELHPTEKPAALIEKLINKSANEGDLIVDPFAGSGTTFEACYKTKRDYILIEKEKKYIDVIHKRIDDVTRQGRLF